MDAPERDGVRVANHNPEFKKMMPPATKKPPCKIRSAAVFILFSLIFVPPVQAENVVLTWDRSDDARVIGYEIFYGSAENDDFKSSPEEIIHGSEKTNCDILGLLPGQTYAFAAKSYDQYGNKSVLSEVIFYNVPEEQKSDDGSSGCFIKIISNRIQQTKSNGHVSLFLKNVSKDAYGQPKTISKQ